MAWSKTRVTAKNMVVAADDYFDQFNQGTFDVKLLSKAHEWAQLQVYNALKAGKTVVAANTNTTLSEMYAYVSKVVFCGFPHKIVFAVMPESNIKVLAQRGLHGVPAKKIKEMHRRMNWWLQKYPPSIAKVIRAGGMKPRRSKDIVLSKEVIYTGIFLHARDQDKVRKYMMSHCGLPLLSHLTDCHLTLKFMPSQAQVDELPFGKKVNIRLIGYATHEYVQCFLVDIMDKQIRKLCTNELPHISVSFNKNVCGPVVSNDLLLNGSVTPTITNCDMDKSDGGLIIEGTIGAFFKEPNGGVRFSKDVEIEEDDPNMSKNQKKKRKRKRNKRKSNSESKPSA